MSEGNITSVKQAAKNLGYRAIAKREGLLSLIAGLCRDQQQLIVGLDGENLEKRCDIEGGATPTRRLVAYFTAKKNLHVSDLRRLVGWDFLNLSCDFVQLPEIPKLADGEVDREKLLHGDYWTYKERQEQIAPRTEVEQLLVGIWGKVLKMERVGVQDNFFELGGHSLLATQLISRVREVFGVELALRSLFEAPTVSGLSERVEQLLGSEGMRQSPALEKASRCHCRMGRSGYGFWISWSPVVWRITCLGQCG